MNTYYCKCGMKVQSSANGETTALKEPERYYPNQLHAYGETPDLSCKGCPYICISRTYKGTGSVDTPVVRLSKHPTVLTTGLGKFSLTDNTVGKIYTLDLDLARRIKDAEKEIDGLLPDNYWDSPAYQASQYHGDGRFTLTINPEGGRKGIAAKQKLYDMFFYPDGSRKDLTPEQEKEKILRGIVDARKAAQGKGACKVSFKSEDVYTNTNGEFYRLHYDESQRAYHTEVKKDGEWKPNNSSWYPHFQDACSEFDAVCRIHKLVKQGEKTCDTDQPEHAGSESATAAEVPAASHADVESAMSTLPDAEPASLAPEFDYSGLDAQTVATLHSAENMIKTARKDYVLKVADAVAMVHDELVTKCHGHNQYSEDTFSAWCEFVGIEKRTAYRLLQVSNLMEASTPNEQKILESAPASLLYAAAKPSAPPELVEQVKSGDITTNKQYQEALAARKAAEEAQRAAEAERDKVRKENAETKEENARLAAENRELQKRPVTEVLPPNPEEVDRLVKEQVGLVWEQNKALKEIIEDREPTPDEKMEMFGQLQRFCRNIIDQWNLIKNNLTVLPKELHDQFREEFIKNLMIMEREVDEN